MFAEHLHLFSLVCNLVFKVPNGRYPLYLKIVYMCCFMFVYGIHVMIPPYNRYLDLSVHIFQVVWNLANYWLRSRMSPSEISYFASFLKKIWIDFEICWLPDRGCYDKAASPNLILFHLILHHILYHNDIRIFSKKIFEMLHIELCHFTHTSIWHSHLKICLK